MVTKLLKKVIPVRPGETTPMLLATSYGFCVLFAFYLLRPVRDEIGAADRGNLQLLWTAVFFVMLLAVPLYSIAVAKLRRGIFVPLANRFFALNLIAFYAALVLLPESARVWIDRVFYVWLSVFALFVVTVFWVWWLTCFARTRANGSSASLLLGHHWAASSGRRPPPYWLPMFRYSCYCCSR